MAQITFTVPDAVATRIIQSTCYVNGYQDNVPDPQNPGQFIPNPVSKVAFLKSIIIEMLKSNLKAYESAATISAATGALNSEVDGINIT